MHDYVIWHYSIDYCVKLSLVDETLFKKKKCSHFKGKLFQPNSLIRGELQKDAINSNFKNLNDNALYMKSVSMPLREGYKILMYSSYNDISIYQPTKIYILNVKFTCPSPWRQTCLDLILQHRPGKNINKLSLMVYIYQHLG